MGLFSFLFGTRRRQPSAPPKPPQTVSPAEISFSQLDITERFDDHLRLQPDDWLATTPLNRSVPKGKGLPPIDAGDEEVYQAGVKLSRLRESIPVPSDGVYCPVCHHANTQLEKLHTPCPKCGRALLKFGWD